MSNGYIIYSVIRPRTGKREYFGFLRKNDKNQHVFMEASDAYTKSPAGSHGAGTDLDPATARQLLVDLGWKDAHEFRVVEC